MAIPENPIETSSVVQVKLHGEVKRKVIEKKKEMRAQGLPSSNSLAILKLLSAL